MILRHIVEGRPGQRGHAGGPAREGLRHALLEPAADDSRVRLLALAERAPLALDNLEPVAVLRLPVGHAVRPELHPDAAEQVAELALLLDPRPLVRLLPLLEADAEQAHGRVRRRQLLARRRPRVRLVGERLEQDAGAPLVLVLLRPAGRSGGGDSQPRIMVRSELGRATHQMPCVVSRNFSTLRWTLSFWSAR